MFIKNKIKIMLITYNRKKKLEHTLKSILSEESPIKTFDITILDNASTDGTSELIEEYCERFSNLKHIRHKINIGGNANIVRAYEMAAASGKEYVWVLCDDDRYDFSNWDEVEKAIEEKKDIICLSDYVFPEGEKENKAYQIFQLTFVPAGIYKASIFTDDVLTNMYDSIYTAFQQSVLTIKVINNEGEIQVLSKPIVFNGIHFKDSDDEVRDDLSLTRGYSENYMSERQKVRTWILGFSNVITLLNDLDLRNKCLSTAIVYKDIYGSWDNFYNCLKQEYLNIYNFNYFFEIYKVLNSKQQKIFRQKYIDNIQKLLIKLKFACGFWGNIWHFMQQIFSINMKNNYCCLKILGFKIKSKRLKPKNTKSFGGGGNS